MTIGALFNEAMQWEKHLDECERERNRVDPKDDLALFVKRQRCAEVDELQEFVGRDKAIRILNET